MATVLPSAGWWSQHVHPGHPAGFSLSGMLGAVISHLPWAEGTGPWETGDLRPCLTYAEQGWTWLGNQLPVRGTWVLCSGNPSPRW